MSDKARRICSLSALLVGAQALAFAAIAQTPDTATPRQPVPDRATSSDTARPMPPSATDRREDRTAMRAVSPQQFATQAATIGKAEIELGQLALQKTKDEDVRKYAQRMVKDHTAADAKLRKIASQEKLTLPQALDAEHLALKQKLSSLQGEAFDREYKKEMAKGHDKAVALFESASQTPQMPTELKEFAASTLPTLEEHKELAQSLRLHDGA